MLFCSSYTIAYVQQTALQTLYICSRYHNHELIAGTLISIMAIIILL